MPIAAGLTALPEDDQHFAIRRLLRGAAPSMLLPLGPFERWQWAGLIVTLVAMIGAAALVTLPGRILNHDRSGTPHGIGAMSWAARGVAAGLVLFGGNW